MESYIPLEYDRSHLDTRKSDQEYGSYVDYCDIALLAFNFLVVGAILLYYFSILYIMQ